MFFEYVIYDGDFEEVKRLVSRYHKIVNETDYLDRTPFDFAIMFGKLKIAKYLWERRGRPNLENYRDGIFTPVHWATGDGHIDTLKWIFTENVLSLDILNFKDTRKWTPFDYAISCGNLEMVQFFFEKGGRPNLEAYRDGKWTPIHWAAQCRYTATLKWVLENNILPLHTLNIKKRNEWTPLDEAIVWGKLEMIQFLFEMGGRPNLEIYRDGSETPVHEAAEWGYTATLKWVFTENIFSLDVLKVKDDKKKTPLDHAIFENQWETAVFIQRLLIDSVFLVMQRAKRDHRCVLRRLPNELLDMVVEEVAVRFHLVVEWR